MLIGKTLLDEEKVTNLISDIKKRKNLSDMNNDFVRNQLFNYLNNKHKLAKDLKNNFQNKSAVYKKTIKEVRNQLRKVYSLFRVDEEIKHRQNLIQQLTPKEHSNIIKKVLQTHSSTKERLPFYEKLYNKIFTITKPPKSIIDLGCGVNPFSVSFTNLKKLNYYAYDISDEEIKALNSYFEFYSKQNDKFWGSAKVLDLMHWEELIKHDKVDLCFLLKMTDVLDRGKGHKVSEAVISLVPSKHVVVSFPTNTISGKRMNFPRRKWVELMCERLKYDFKIIKYINEIFYVIKK